MLHFANGSICNFRSAAVPAAAGGSGKAFEIFGIRSEFSCAAGEETRAPAKLTHYLHFADVAFGARHIRFSA
jgi:hypothetical protein